MSDDREPALHAAIEALYAVFAPYPTPPASVFCTFCNTEDEIADRITTELRALGPEPARRMLWQPGDHWGGADPYKHYLPRLLEALAPPERCADLYPMHLFEVLAFLQFGTWPAAERAAVGAFLDEVTGTLELDSAEDAEAWGAAVRALAGRT